MANTADRRSNIVHQTLQRSAYTFRTCHRLWFLHLRAFEGGFAETIVCISALTVTDLLPVLTIKSTVF